MELFLGTEKGNASLAVIENAPRTQLLLQTEFVIECIAPASLFVDRFLPPTPITVLVDQNMREYTGETARLFRSLKGTGQLKLLDNPEVRERLIPAIFHKSKQIADAACDEIVRRALDSMKAAVGNEINRLETLKERNPSISSREIDAARDESNRLASAIETASPRLDSIRLIWAQGPAE
jgi:ATP-dependent helicase HepA